MTDRRMQSDKFKGAARELECDDDGTNLYAQLKKLLKHKPVRQPE
jgi:hypothetical protein